jgi:lysophospholipase L1-like esterase
MSSAERKRMSIWKRIVLVVAIVIGILVASIELGSRAADGIVEKRRATPGYDAKESKKTLAGKLWIGELDPLAQLGRDARTQPHPYLGYVPKPGFWSLPGDAQQCSHNSLGFRGKETTWEKPPGVFRIVTNGGSSVYGQSESSDAAVWSAKLEGFLTETKTSKHVEVINAGCSGWTSFEMLINLELRVMDLHPDVVLIYESVNDMRAALYTAGGPVPLRDNTHWRCVWQDVRVSPLESFLSRSRTYMFIQRYVTGEAERRQDLFTWSMKNYDPHRNDLYCGGARGYPDGKVPEQGFTNYRRNLENMIRIADAGGAKVLITTQALMMWDMPPRECADTQIASFRRIQDIQREVASERGVALSETGAAIEAEEARHFAATGKRLFKNDVHPFDEGSELIAHTIADAIEAQHLLPK